MKLNENKKIVLWNKINIALSIFLLVLATVGAWFFGMYYYGKIKKDIGF